MHGHRGLVCCMKMHPAINVLASGSDDGKILVWDVRTSKSVRVLKGHSSLVTTVQCKSVEPQVISGGLDTTVKFWDLGTSRCIVSKSIHTDAMQSIVYCDQR